MVLTKRQPQIRTILTIQKEKEKKEQYKQIAKIFAITAIAFVTFAFFFAVFGTDAAEANHWNLPADQFEIYKKLNALQKFAFQLVYFAYGAFGAVGNFLQGVLSINTTDDVWLFFESMYNSVASVGYGLACVWSLLELVDKSNMDNVTPEIFCRWAIKLIFAIVLIQNGPELVKLMAELGNQITNTFMDTGKEFALSSNGEVEQALDDMAHNRLIPTISVVLRSIIPAIFMIITILFMLVQLVGRYIEIGVRMAFMPIGIADACNHGLSSPGIRYIKKFFAVCLQGAGMVAVVLVGTQLNTKVAPDGEWYIPALGWLMQIVIGVSTVGAMMKSQSIVNDAVGA